MVERMDGLPTGFSCGDWWFRFLSGGWGWLVLEIGLDSASTFLGVSGMFGYGMISEDVSLQRTLVFYSIALSVWVSSFFLCGSIVR